MAHPRACPMILAPLLALMALVAPHARAQLIPERVYFGLNRAIPCRVETPADADAGCAVELALLDPTSGAPVERSSLARPEKGTPSEVLDLAQVFPILWTERRPRMLYAQLIVDNVPTGSPLVLEPLLTPRRYRDELTERVLDAFARRDAAELTRLLALSDRAKARMRESVRERRSDEPPILSGLRVYPLSDVVLETTEGDMRVRLDPPAAPRTTFRFLQLVKDGFYEEIAFHRIVNADAEGMPFIVQCGDPTGTGLGGVGDLMDFEPSTLPHDRGVLSIARRSDDPNASGSQFFICLGREACAKLDGRYTAIGRVESGLDTLDAIAATPVAPPERNEGEGVAEHPIHPPILHHARLVPAPPEPIAPVRPAPATPSAPTPPTPVVR